MSAKSSFSLHEAALIAEQLGIDLAREHFRLEDFRAGLDVELEHGSRNPETNVTGDDPLTTGRIALAHLREIPDYYVRLRQMELEAEDARAEALDPA
jgi:hypothetical protein